MFSATVATVSLLLALSPLAAADFSTYRGLTLGISVAAAAKVAGTVPGEAIVVHKRPALLQEMHWRPGSTSNDSVQDALLSFYNGELTRIVITYDRYRVEGMTTKDMVDGISKIYGAATVTGTAIPFHSIYGETAAVLARWQEGDSAWNLVRTGDGASYALVGFSVKRDALSFAAEIEATRLETEEAPQREAARQKQRDSDESTAMDKARATNKPAFKP